MKPPTVIVQHLFVFRLKSLLRHRPRSRSKFGCQKGRQRKRRWKSREVKFCRRAYINSIKFQPSKQQFKVGIQVGTKRVKFRRRPLASTKSIEAHQPMSTKTVKVRQETSSTKVVSSCQRNLTIAKICPGNWRGPSAKKRGIKITCPKNPNIIWIKEILIPYVLLGLYAKSNYAEKSVLIVIRADGTITGWI